METDPVHRRSSQLLQAHAWPGNVRELRNVVERLLLLATDAEVNADTVQLALPSSTSAASLPQSTFNGPLADRVQSFERETILAELKRQPVAYHQYRQSPWPRTQPPLQKSPSIGNRLGESSATAKINCGPVDHLRHSLCTGLTPEAPAHSPAGADRDAPP